MDKELDKKIELLIAKARSGGKHMKKVTVVNTSSLARIIKTEKQAKQFMKMLKDA